MRVLVTGATGFIGSYVIPALLRHGHGVIATSAQEAKATIQSWFRDVEYKPLDFSRLEPAVDYFAYFGRPDAMIHLAWEGLPNYKSEFHLTENLPHHQQLLENLVRHGLRDLTVTGTCFEYGMQEGCLSESMPARPDNPYALAKDRLRIFLEALQSRYEFVLKWPRLFYMYGKGQNPKSLLSQLDAALERGDSSFNMSGGDQVRDYLPVEAVAEYLLAIALQKETTGVINCCSNQPVTVKQLVEEQLNARGRIIHLNLGYYPYPDFEPMAFWGDDTKLKKIKGVEIDPGAR